LADALLSLAAAPDRRIAMGVAGQTRIRDELNWNEYARRLLEIYTAAVGGSR
jgi:glycosyltransferase involved in cell wall biosynthesis